MKVGGDPWLAEPLLASNKTTFFIKVIFLCRPFSKATGKSDCWLRWAHRLNSPSAWNSSTPTDWVWVKRVTGHICWSYWALLLKLLGTSAEVTGHFCWSYWALCWSYWTFLLKLLDMSAEVTGHFCWKLLDTSSEVTGHFCWSYWARLLKLLDTSEITGHFLWSYWALFWSYWALLLKLLGTSYEVTGHFCWS